MAAPSELIAIELINDALSAFNSDSENINDSIALDRQYDLRGDPSGPRVQYG